MLLAVMALLACGTAATWHCLTAAVKQWQRQHHNSQWPAAQGLHTIRGPIFRPRSPARKDRRMKTCLRKLALGLACLAMGGCAADGRLFNPGNIYSQRLRATIHDPYSDQDLGPEVVGGRPRDYQQQLAEPVRNRLYVDSYVP